MVGQHWCKATFFQNKAAQITKIVKSHVVQVKQKPGCCELPIEITLLGLPYVVKAASTGYFQQQPC